MCNKELLEHTYSSNATLQINKLDIPTERGFIATCLWPLINLIFFLRTNKLHPGLKANMTSVQRSHLLTHCTYCTVCTTNKYSGDVLQIMVMISKIRLSRQAISTVMNHLQVYRYRNLTFHSTFIMVRLYQVAVYYRATLHVEQENIMLYGEVKHSGKL